MTTSDSERIGKLEVSVSGIHNELAEIRTSIRGIADAIGKASTPNMGVMVAGAGLIVSLFFTLYGAAIHPIAREQDRLARDARDLADAVRRKDVEIRDLRSENVKHETLISYMGQRLESIEQNGSAPMDRRLSLIELQMKLHGDAVAEDQPRKRR